jgi:hypothetical protein
MQNKLSASLSQAQSNTKSSRSKMSLYSSTISQALSKSSKRMNIDNLLAEQELNLPTMHHKTISHQDTTSTTHKQSKQDKHKFYLSKIKENMAKRLNILK